MLGPNPAALRVVTLVVHQFNSLLLAYWITSMHRCTSIHYKSEHVWIVSMACALLYYVHPLNMEVVGWLSAQSYSLALTFTLASNICLEKLIARAIQQRRSRPTMAYPWAWQLGAVGCYSVACLVSAGMSMCVKCTP